MFDLSGRVGLVTGGGQNVGAGIARSLAAQGAAVAINDLVEERARVVAEEIAAQGGKAVAAAFDVSSGAAVAEGIAVAEQALGPIDILVNNAGVPPGMGLTPFREQDPDDWTPFIDLNLYGVLHCCKAVIDGMCERGFGRIVTISSGAGQVGIPLGISTYGAGKGGALSFMRHLAMEVAGQGVTANSLALGLMASGTGDDTAAIAKTVPVGRVGFPEDIGAAVVYLASNEAAWVTGQTIGINGGNLTS
ncbi:MAG: short-chain dehydrogenase [Deltaproteobacteria bacterium]|nr:short-chain dehydrogenase [Deltaproteobacteria bacterium]